MVNIVNALIPIAKIRPHPENYNQHPDEQIAQLEASYQEFGQFNSIVVWQRPNGEYIQVARRGFLTGATNKGATEIRADILPEDTDPMLIKRILLADNLHAKNSIPDDTMLAQLLQEQQNAGFDLASLGSDAETLRQMLETLGDEYVGESHEGAGGDEFDTTPQEQGPARSHVGELWQLGKHRLLVGDSTKPEDVEQLMQGRQSDMLFADPPYDLALDWTSVAEHYCTKHWLVMAGDKQQAALSAKYQHVFNGFYVLYFRQFSWNLNKYIPMLTHVLTAHLRFANAKNYDLNGMHSLTESPSKFDKEQEHRHAKHLDYLQQFIEGFSTKNDIVFVPFLGSGTELIACERAGRICYGIEIEPRYVDVILSRFEAETGQTAVLLDRVAEVARV